MIYINSLVVFLGIVVMADAQMCYSPDGTAFPTDSPCHSPSIVDGASACCNTHDVCLNNGLCLSQAGGEFIYRGTCTDQSWHSPNCSQYCADDSPSGGATINLIHSFQNQWVSCCGPGFANNNTCSRPTKGSTTPFFIEDGLVIFNRTSGSTSPNNTETTLVTVTATVTTAGPVSVSTSLSTTRPSSSLSLSSSSQSSSSSRTGTVVGAGLLLREKKHKESFKKDAETWKMRHADMVQSQKILVNSSMNEREPRQPSDDWNFSELHGESQLPHQLDGWDLSELPSKPRLPSQLQS
ncbi:hypothetical protein BDR22DRAFT_824195 [Usnea florida]